MALRNYRQKTDTFHAGGADVTIHGLTLNEATLLVDAYWPHLKAVYDFYGSTDSTASVDERVSQTILECVRIAPELAASIIAIAAGEPDATAEAKSLPFTVTIDALVKIVTLTMVEAGGLGNFLAVLRRAVDSAKTALPATAAPQPSDVPREMPDPLSTH